MRDDQLFGVVASLALLIWLGSRRFLTGPGARRAEMLALVLVVAGIAYALIRTAIWFAA
jgi:hypothetical protein